MIDADKYNRSVGLLCPTCGSTQFEYDAAATDDQSPVKCASCQLVLTRAALIEANSENISEHISEIGKEVIGDIKKDLQRALAGNRFIKIT